MWAKVKIDLGRARTLLQLFLFIYSLPIIITVKLLAAGTLRICAGDYP